MTNAGGLAWEVEMEMSTPINLLFFFLFSTSLRYHCFNDLVKILRLSVEDEAIILQAGLPSKIPIKCVDSTVEPHGTVSPNLLIK